MLNFHSNINISCYHQNPLNILLVKKKKDSLTFVKYFYSNYPYSETQLTLTL